MKNELLEKIASAYSSPAITISLKTHRTFPESQKDEIRVKNMLKEAADRLLKEYDKKDALRLIEKLDIAMANYDYRYSLDSLHIFVSEELTEVVRSPWTVDESSVHISNRFVIKPLIVMQNRMSEYLVLLLSKEGTRLYKAENDRIAEEIQNDVFPSLDNPFTTANNTQASDGEKVDKLILEYFNRLDKAMVQVNKDTGLSIIVITTADNYNKLLKVADKPVIYQGFAAINYNNNTEPALSSQAWTVVQANQKENRTKLIEEMQSAVNRGEVVTDLSEIYEAAKSGRADLLIVHNEFKQGAVINADGSFTLEDNTSTPVGVLDISSEIAREVIAKKGRVIFTNQDEIKDLGKITLKVRY